ncbi:BICD family-like cargo adapter 1 [Bagarius yarrelli]|uniref:BICD family-like cargo adapter 1 n=1 Tax=Bagarius yarrelli TaxID=175774 RepID=A0A556UYJ7_BAGYA|nr:BICD family-like cargo adapter 1 [Bagarius yarrelli]
MSRLEELCFRAHRMDLDLEEDFYPYGDGGEVRAALRRKEEELVLAAQLGNALLTENRQLKEEKNQLQEHYAEKIEELEQDRHDLRLKLQGCRAQWESQVLELERDIRMLNAQSERLTRQLSETERGKSLSEEQHNRISQQFQEQLQELADAWQEVELGKGKVQDLQSQIEELEEEVSFQRTTDANTSLLSEMEHSLDAINWSQDKEQVIQDVSSILHMLHPDSSCSQDDSLQSMLGQLKSVAERIVHNKTLQELKRPIVGGDMALCENPAWIQELRDQLKADSSQDKEIVQRAIKDRDDAISKKTAIEAELVRSRNDMMYLNNQLLEAIQRKLELSQELEAWQDDIQVIINQQLKSQTEQQMQSKRSGGGRISFFRKHLKSSSSVSCIPETTAVSNGSPWINWLKVAK